MIIREISTNFNDTVSSFDWFNDYDDTRAYILYMLPNGNCDDIMKLDFLFRKWLKKFQQQ